MSDSALFASIKTRQEVPSRASQRGITLIEIVITVAIMTVGMLGYFTLHFRALQLNSSTSNTAQATTLALAVQDSLQSIAFTPETLADSTTGAYFADCGPITTDRLANLCRALATVNEQGTTDTQDGPLIFNRSYHVTSVAGTTPPMFRVTVRVRYPAEDGRCPDCSGFKTGFRAISLTTYRTQTNN